MQKKTTEPKPLADFRSMLMQRKFDAADKTQVKELCSILNITGRKDLDKAKEITQEVISELEAISDTRSKVKRKYKEQYAANGGNCGDDVAAAFKEMKEAGWTVQEIGKQNDIDVDAKWGHLRLKDGRPNDGMQTMNLSNVLRNRIKRKEPTYIGDYAYYAG